ncbi:hypothetical protein scyTo_0007220 [Scyliorhinus torazame]|uniref:Uncharacterized protein n=1 Tax=Scyliorhinus torazame TaxID=75743 RepID=A0A401NNB3_SCYTO|nr:hypothetical protein [Scyliorhinus torazame]
MVAYDTVEIVESLQRECSVLVVEYYLEKLKKHCLNELESLVQPLYLEQDADTDEVLNVAASEAEPEAEVGREVGLGNGVGFVLHFEVLVESAVVLSEEKNEFDKAVGYAFEASCEVHDLDAPD